MKNNKVDREKWQHDAEKVVKALALWSAINNEPFTSNDVWATGLLATPPNRRWLGPIMKAVERQGWMTRIAYGVESEHGHGATNNALWLGQGA